MNSIAVKPKEEKHHADLFHRIFSHFGEQTFKVYFFLILLAFTFLFLLILIIRSGQGG